MSYESLAHRLMLDGREKLSLSGVEHVECFDESQIVLRTALGDLTVTGENLHIDALSLDGGEMSVSGTVTALVYEDTARNGQGFFARLFA